MSLISLHVDRSRTIEEAFLIATGNGPEKQELLRLIGTLISGFPPATFYGDLE